MARLSEEVRFWPGETSSSSKCLRRAVVGFIIGHSFVPERKSELVNKLGLISLKSGLDCNHRLGAVLWTTSLNSFSSVDSF